MAGRLIHKPGQAILMLVAALVIGIGSKAYINDKAGEHCTQYRVPSPAHARCVDEHNGIVGDSGK